MFYSVFLHIILHSAAHVLQPVGYGAHVSEACMKPLPVVKHLDETEQGLLYFLYCSILQVEIVLLKRLAKKFSIQLLSQEQPALLMLPSMSCSDSIA